MSLSNYLELELLDHVLGNGVYTPPSTIYVALFTSNPDEDGSGTEVSGGSYARQAAAFDAASGGIADNTGEIEFPEATASWGTVTHVALFDAVSAGNMLWYGALAASKTIDSTDQYGMHAGDLDISLD